MAKDFLKILDTKVSPVKGRELKNGMLEGTWDYKTWVEQLGLQISGLVPNARAVGGDEHRVNHSWRFIRRCDTCVKTCFCWDIYQNVFGSNVMGLFEVNFIYDFFCALKVIIFMGSFDTWFSGIRKRLHNLSGL